MFFGFGNLFRISLQINDGLNAYHPASELNGRGSALQGIYRFAPRKHEAPAIIHSHGASC
jgi:hypothetical protein